MKRYWPENSEPDSPFQLLLKGCTIEAPRRNEREKNRTWRVVIDNRELVLADRPFKSDGEERTLATFYIQNPETRANGKAKGSPLSKKREVVAPNAEYEPPASGITRAPSNLSSRASVPHEGGELTTRGTDTSVRPNLTDGIEQSQEVRDATQGTNDAVQTQQNVVNQVVNALPEKVREPIKRVVADLTFQLLLKGCTIEAASITSFDTPPYSFSCCWKDVRLKHRWAAGPCSPPSSFSCCWKDVRLKRFYRRGDRDLKEFQLLLKGCTIEATTRRRPFLMSRCFSCCWKDVRLKRRGQWAKSPWRRFQLLLKGCTIEAGRNQNALERSVQVSVVVERMYDWSSFLFSCVFYFNVSVVVERMYDWSVDYFFRHAALLFQLLLKGCTIEAPVNRGESLDRNRFQLLLKGCTIEAPGLKRIRPCFFRFQLLLKGCTIEATAQSMRSGRF